jgi:leucyl aminopeptidase
MQTIRLTFASGKLEIKKGNKHTARVLFSGKNDTEVYVDSQGIKTISLGVGKKNDITNRKFIILARRIINLAKAHKIKKVYISFEDFLFPKLKSVAKEEVASMLAQNFEMANFEFTKFKQVPKDGWNRVTDIVIHDVNEKIKKGFKKGQTIGKEINNCRVLANTPGGDMTPRLLAEDAQRACRGTKVQARVLGKKEIAKLKMGAVLGVAQGSDEEPKFIILEYKGGKKNDKPVVLVGKGVTFDTGGINLKPSSAVLDMHMDMSGGAAVIYTLVLASKLGLKKNVVGLVPAVENMPSGSSYRPGDILKSMSGKTIEVLNTDAEGRIILADALTYAKRYSPKLVVDVATLTGAALVALGQKASVILTKDEKLEKQLRRLGEESGEYVWPLPLWDEYEEETKGNFADLANISTGNASYGGTINGGAFLYQFVKDKKNGSASYPWAHIDMAPRMVSSNGDNLAKGAAGAPVRLLIKLLEEF